MGLVAQVLNPALLSDGTTDSRNWRGKLIIEVTWRSLPSFGDIVADGWAGFDFSAYLNLPAGLTATYSLSGSIPAGVTIGESTGVMTPPDTPPVTFTGRVVATVSGRAFASPQFSINFVAAPAEAGDTEAPSYSLNISATTVEVAGVQKVDLAIMRANDTAADDEEPSGLGTYTIIRDASPLASGTDIAIPDPGESIRLTGQNCGGGLNGSTVRSGSNYTVTARGTGFGSSTGESGHRAYALVPRDNLNFGALLRGITGDVVTGSTMWLRISSDSDVDAPEMAMAYVNANGARIRGRSTPGTASSAGTNFPGITLPAHLRGAHLGANVYEFFVSPGDEKPTAESWVSLGTRTVALSSTVRVDVGASASGNGTAEVVAEFENFSGSSLPAIAFRDENPTPNSNHVYAVIFDDVDENTGASSGALTVAVPAGTTDEDGPTDPVVTLTAGQNQVSGEFTSVSTDPSGVAGYTIKYGTSEPPSTVWNNTDTVLHTAGTFTITGLDDSTLYYVTVQPRDNANNSGNVVATAPASVTTFDEAPAADTRQPPKPTVTVSQIAGNPNALRVSVMRGANPEGIAVTGTKVFYGTTDGATGLQFPLANDEVVPVGGSTTQIDVPATQAQHWITARDHNAAGSPSQFSSRADIYGPIEPASEAPTTGSLSYLAAFNSSQANLHFNANNVGNWVDPRTPQTDPYPIWQTTFARSGEGAYRHKIDPTSQVMPNNGSPLHNFRSEAVLNKSGSFFNFVDEVWFGWSIMLASDYLTADPSHGVIVAQIHQSAWTHIGGGGPPIHLLMEPVTRQREITIAWNTDPNVVPTGTPQNNRSTKKYRAGVAWPTMTWLDVVMNIKPAYQASQNGHVRLYVFEAGRGIAYQASQPSLPAAGQQSFSGGTWVVNHTGPNMYNSSLLANTNEPERGTNGKHQFKTGGYIAAWKFGTTVTASRTLYFSDFRCGYHKNGVRFADVVPRGTSR